MQFFFHIYCLSFYLSSCLQRFLFGEAAVTDTKQQEDVIVKRISETFCLILL